MTIMHTKQSGKFGGSQWVSDSVHPPSTNNFNDIANSEKPEIGESQANTVQNPVRIPLSMRLLIGMYRRVPGGSFVYFFQREDGAIKIGFSRCPVERFHEVRMQLPGRELKILAICGGSSFTEASLHRAFADFNIEGEWFRPAPEILELVSCVSQHVSDCYNQSFQQYYRNCLAGLFTDQQPRSLTRKAMANFAPDSAAILREAR